MKNFNSFNLKLFNIKRRKLFRFSSVSRFAWNLWKIHFFVIFHAWNETFFPHKFGENLNFSGMIFLSHLILLAKWVRRKKCKFFIPMRHQCYMKYNIDYDTCFIMHISIERRIFKEHFYSSNIWRCSYQHRFVCKCSVIATYMK